MDKEEFKAMKARFLADYNAKHPKVLAPRKNIKHKRKLNKWERRAHKKRPGPKRKPKYRPELYATVERKKKEWAGKGWAPWEINGALKQLQENTYTIAYSLGIKRSHVTCVISREYEWLWRKTVRVRFRIADLLEETYEDVWGEEKPYYFARFV